jgi:ZIP family zinc transporter
MEVGVLVLAGTATALATGLGAVPVFLLGTRAEMLRPLLWGLAIGLMGVASISGLLLPALDEGSVGEAAGGAAAGVLFLLGTRRLLAARDPHVGGLRGAGVRRSRGAVTGAAMMLALAALLGV